MEKKWTKEDYAAAAAEIRECYEQSDCQVAECAARAALDAVAHRLAAQAEKPDTCSIKIEQTGRTYCSQNEAQSFGGQMQNPPREQAPERVPGPFVLTPNEDHAFKLARFVCDENQERLNLDSARKLVGAVERALRTLGPTEREKELEDQRYALARELVDLRDAIAPSSLSTQDSIAQVHALREREKELERKLGVAVNAAIDSSKQCGELDAQIEQANERAEKAEAELEELRKRTSEPEGDRLTVEPLSETEREALESAQQIYDDSEEHNARDAVASVLARFPKPAPADPLQELLAGWESLTGNAAIVWGEAAKSVREALRAKK